MKYAVFLIATGAVVKTGNCPAEAVAGQAGVGERSIPVPQNAVRLGQLDIDQLRAAFVGASSESHFVGNETLIAIMGTADALGLDLPTLAAD